MIYVLFFTLVGVIVLLAIGTGIQDLQTVNTELELEKMKLRRPQEIQEAKKQGQQATRAEIAEVINNQLTDLLRSADLELSAVSNFGCQPIEKVTRIIESIAEQLRNFDKNSELMREGLDKALHILAARLSTGDFQVTFDFDVERLNLSKEKELFLYQACAELIQNTMKHSTATTCKVSIVDQKHYLCLRVIDNGINVKNKNVKLGYGLDKLKIKSQALGGHFSFILTDFGAESELLLPYLKVG